MIVIPHRQDVQSSMTAESRPPPSLGIIVLAAFGLTEASLKECSAFHPSLVGRPLRPVRSVHATSSGKAKHCLSVHRKAATTGAGESRTEEHGQKGRQTKHQWMSTSLCACD
uniref:Uncharacterized protein n=1 Tax=Vitrella brassicaformis TaxID=1169539 RepID=A0A7S1K027_9ALVE